MGLESDPVIIGYERPLKRVVQPGRKPVNTQVMFLLELRIQQGLLLCKHLQYVCAHLLPVKRLVQLNKGFINSQPGRQPRSDTA